MDFLDTIDAEIAKIDEEQAAFIRKLDEHAKNAPEAPADDATDEVRTAWQSVFTEYESAGDALIAEAEKLNERKAALRARRGPLQTMKEEQERVKAPVYMKRHGDPTDVDVTRLSTVDAVARAKTLVEESPLFLSDEHRNEVTKRLEQKENGVNDAAARLALVTGTETYFRAWSKRMADVPYFTKEEAEALERAKHSVSAEERAGMTAGTGSTGGYFVPVVIDPTMIITGAGSYDPIRQLATVKQIGPAFGGWYGVTAGQVTAAWTAETVSAPDNTPTLTQPNIPVYMAEEFIPYSFQAEEDIASLASDILELFMDAKTNLEAIAHQTGDGSSKPKGVVYAVAAVTASRVAPQTGGTFGINDPYTVQNALPARFWNKPNVAWLGHQTVFNKIRTLAQAQNSANSYWTDPSPAVPPQLLGRSVNLASEMNSTITTGQNLLLYGDFSRYYVIDRVGFATERVPFLFDTSTGRPTAQRGMLGYWRTGGDCVDTAAFRLLQL